MSAPGLPLLQAVYWKVLSISDYVRVLHTGSEHRGSVLQGGDTVRYRTFLSELLVCIPQEAKKLCAPISFLQLSTQQEVVARVIQRICEKNKKNVLAFGYGLVAEKSSLRVKFAPNICNYFPNPTTATVSTSVLWETLLSRIGDDVMMHLLENCSLFMKVPPSCCYQICGQPIYNLTKEETPSLRLKQCRSMYKRNILSRYIHTHSLVSKTSRSQKSIGVKAHTEVMFRAGKIQSRTSPLKNRDDLVKFATKKRRTRSPQNNISDIPAKRRKVEANCTDLHKSGRVTTEAHLVRPGGHIVQYCTGQSEPAKRSAASKETLDATTENYIVSDFVEPQNKAASYNSVCTSSDRTSPCSIFVDFGKVLCTNPFSREGFLESFILNMLESNSRSSLSLIERIFMNNNLFEQDFDFQTPPEGKRKKKVCKRYWQLIPVFQELIENHKLCSYKSLLKKHCPVKLVGKSRAENILGENNEDGASNLKRLSVQCNESNTVKTVSKSGKTIVQSLSNREIVTNQSNLHQEKRNTELVLDLLKQHNSVWQVYTFVRECLHKVVPESLWGSSHNKCRFLRNVKMLIKSVKCEKMSLQKLMFKMRVEDCSWLRLNKYNHFVPASEHLLREKILSKFLFWLMDTYVIQLLKAFYYITESSFQKNRLFFYRKSIWGQLQKIGIRKHMTNVKLRLMSTDEIETIQQQKNTPLISRLRFVPKTNGLRPIAKTCNTLGAQQSKEMKERKIQHFNTQVRNLYSVLNYETNKSSNLIGSSVFGLDGIYKKWKKYVLGLKESNSRNVNLYFVKTDIKEAYDTIPHTKLEEVISKVIKPDIEEVYCIRRYAMLWMDSLGRIRKSFKRHVSNLVDFRPNMKCFLTHFQEGNSIKNAILVEQSLSLNENSSKLLAFFQQIIFNHILRINDRYYMQCCGIPQGSMLSALLCSLCYGDMENKLFCGIQENGIFMRFIDDFLLVTPHLEQAKRFLRTLAKGIPEYGCSVSLDKTVVNFPIDDISVCFTVEQLPAHSLFRWCGLLLDTQTLEVLCDYSSFSCTSIRASLSFCHSSKAGENLKNKLLNVLRLKCHSLFLDLQVNSLRTVYINAYKILLLQAYRFHACVIQLPFDQSIKNNPMFFLTVISDMAPCFYMILKEKNKGFTLGTKDASGPFPFEVAQWLIFHAFITKLSNHKSLYKTLLVPLHHCKKQLSRTLPNETMGLLKEVTDASLHKDFSTIMD